MALRASYYGVKRNLKDELKQLDGIIPAGASSDNKLITKYDINQVWDCLSRTGVGNMIGPVDTYTFVKSSARTHRFVTTIPGVKTTDAVILKFHISAKSGFTTTLEQFGLRLEDRHTGSVWLTDPIYISKDDGADDDVTIVFSLKEASVANDAINIYAFINTSEDAAATITITNMQIYYADMTVLGYQGWAKTNEQLTGDITTINSTVGVHNSKINAIISAATEAADFAAFKTAMESITPLTRTVAASDTRSIPEEDPEPEAETKTVKRTTKKTVKEGE